MLSSPWPSDEKVLAASPGIPALGQAAFSPLFGLELNEEGN